MQKYLRGQVWFYNDNQINVESNIQKGERPVIIISNNIGNKNSPCLTVVPCTAQDKPNLPTHFIFYIKKTQNTALCEQIKTIDKIDMGRYIGTLSDEEINQLNKCIDVAISEYE